MAAATQAALTAIVEAADSVVLHDLQAVLLMPGGQVDQVTLRPIPPPAAGAVPPAAAILPAPGAQPLPAWLSGPTGADTAIAPAATSAPALSELVPGSSDPSIPQALAPPDRNGSSPPASAPPALPPPATAPPGDAPGGTGASPAVPPGGESRPTSRIPPVLPSVGATGPAPAWPLRAGATEAAPPSAMAQPAARADGKTGRGGLVSAATSRPAPPPRVTDGAIVTTPTLATPVAVMQLGENRRAPEGDFDVVPQLEVQSLAEAQPETQQQPKTPLQPKTLRTPRALGQHPTVLGRIVLSARGQVLLDTALGTIVPRAPLGGSPGQTLRFEILTRSPVPQHEQLAVQNRPAASLARTLPALPPPLAQALEKLLAAPDRDPRHAVMSMLAASRSEGLPRLVQFAAEALRETGAGLGARDLETAFAETRMPGNEAPDRWWHAVPLPWAHALHGPARLLRPVEEDAAERRSGDPSEAESSPAASVRLLIELDLHQLGPLQLDLRYRAGRLDLVLRSWAPFIDTLRQAAQRCFQESLAKRDIAGRLSFAGGTVFPVDPATRPSRMTVTA